MGVPFARNDDKCGNKDKTNANISKYEEAVEANAKDNEAPGSLDAGIGKMYAHSGGSSKIPVEMKRKLEGHIRKVQGMSWGPTEALSKKIFASDQGGKCVIWDAGKGIKEKVISKTFVMTTELHPNGKHAFIGGMDNLINVYDYSKDGIECNNIRQLEGHDGYIASIQFPTENTMVTCGGDADICKWDLSTYKPVMWLSGHEGDASGGRFPRDKGCHPERYLTCSCDKTARVWDMTAGKQTHCFALSAEANACAFFPNGNLVAVGCHDGKMFLFDLRSHLPLQKLARKNNRVAACDFSLSGRTLIAAYEDGHVGMWDPFKNFGGKDTQYDHKVDCHFSNQSDSVKKIISKAAFSYDGSAFATGAYDATIKIWANKAAEAGK